MRITPTVCLCYIVMGSATAVAGPATSATQGSEAIEQGLVRSLVKPYWQQTAQDWEFFFRRQFDGGPFDVAGRDRTVRAIGATVVQLARPQQARVVILEHIGNLGMYGSYERAVLAISPEPLPDGLGVRVIDPEKWAALQGPLEAMLHVGGRSNGWTRMIHGADALVITYFNGSDWRTETWFCISSPDFASPPAQKAADLQPQMLEYARLLRAINNAPAVTSFQRANVLPSMLPPAEGAGEGHKNGARHGGTPARQ